MPLEFWFWDLYRGRMLTKNDLKAIEKILEPRFIKIDEQFAGIRREFKRNDRRHDELQNSINIIVDTTCDDVDLIEERMERVEMHLGLALG